VSPLEGKTVLVTRAREQAEALCRRLEALGARPVLLPLIDVFPPSDLAAVDRALARLEEFDWLVFTSANGVRFFRERWKSPSLPERLRIAAIGPATAAALEREGLPVHAVPREFRGESLPEALGPLAGKRVLLARADIGREETAAAFAAAGAIVEDVAFYRVGPATPDPEGLAALRAGVDVLTFTSPSTVRSFVSILGEEARTLARSSLVACIGPVTAEAAREAGLPVHLQPADYTVDGLLEALAQRAR